MLKKVREFCGSVAALWRAWTNQTPRSDRTSIVNVEFGIASERCRALCQQPETMIELYRSVRGEIKKALPDNWQNLSDTQQAYLFACAVAHNLKPYGPGSDPSLQSMLRAPSLDCSNFGLLMHYLAKMCLSEAASPHPVFVGWDGGAVGNHQMVFLSEVGADLLLDPTSGLAVQASFNHVAAGRPVAARDIVGTQPTKQLEAPRQDIVEAFRSGALRPSDLLYYFDSVDHLLNDFGHPRHWPTPGAVSWREQQRRLHPND